MKKELQPQPRGSPAPGVALRRGLPCKFLAAKI